ncbi:uncharacterized protein BP01DRAFT_310816 [Aspergillus saccharolyticus JOP 1030-1]|uniref:Uncharacterized protein n=1 Tax=Aspergillus saccharolyticus JOP 1030-1 TaxID=1450539 RepID=A0A318ZQJ6_9EURO|nr:hypothetical protein BP01DRAFT_310816 [Aspergillus saccharolyticus JOP 1030-1]PYH49327.1 hypothetical protein BP01DRAFT_310816 [Aspergillus saccharolyticus JOP 1030-1]
MNLARLAHRLLWGQRPISARQASSSLADIVRRGEFRSLEDEAVVQLLHRSFATEIARLKRVPTRPGEGDGSVPPGTLVWASGKEKNDERLTPSRLLFQEDFCEVNRSITNVLAVKWLMSDQYEVFTAHQPLASRLSVETFRAFRSDAQSVLDDPEQLLALIVALVVGDLGKDPQLARDMPASQGRCNHDELLAQAVDLGFLDGPLGLLGPPQREDVILGIQVGATLNLPQLLQGENVPASLQAIFRFQSHSSAFFLKYLEIMFDVAGSAAHLDARGAITMTEPVCQSYLQALPILQEVVAGRTSLRQAYDKILHRRGQILTEQGFRQLCPGHPADRALLRLLAMGRVADRDLAEKFQQAFASLSEETRDALVRGLNVDGHGDGTAVVLYYMPSVFAEALRARHDGSFEDYVAALQSIMRFMARNLEAPSSASDPEGEVPIRERDVSPVREIVSSAQFRRDPQILDNYKLPELSNRRRG